MHILRFAPTAIALLSLLSISGTSQVKATKKTLSKGMYNKGLTLKQVYRMPCEQQIPFHLNWCSTDHGYNEGATCGLYALTKTGVSLPGDVGQAALGNLWDRTNMMGVTKAAYKLGAKEQAIDAAICCQIQNPSAQTCLASHRDLVGQWLASN